MPRKKLGFFFLLSHSANSPDGIESLMQLLVHPGPGEGDGAAPGLQRNDALAPGVLCDVEDFPQRQCDLLHICPEAALQRRLSGPLQHYEAIDGFEIDGHCGGKKL